MKLSKKEARYRVKLIQEGHLNKGEQKLLDRVAANNGIGYGGIYKNQTACVAFVAGIEMRRFAKAAAKAGTTCRELTESLKTIGTVSVDQSEFASYEKGDTYVVGRSVWVKKEDHDEQ